jgi:hypothetical protein
MLLMLLLRLLLVVLLMVLLVRRNTLRGYSQAIGALQLDLQSSYPNS